MQTKPQWHATSHAPKWLSLKKAGNNKYWQGNREIEPFIYCFCEWNIKWHRHRKQAVPQKFKYRITT